MKTTYTFYAILVFAVIASITTPHLLRMIYSNNDVTYESNKKNEMAATSVKVDNSTEVMNEASSVDVAIAMSELKEEKQENQEETKIEAPVVKEVVPVDPIVYDNMTMSQLTEKLNKVLGSSLSGTGEMFANETINNGVDPYVAVAIVLQETGCKWSCSSAVRNYNNVGGMYSGGSLIHYASLSEGITAFVNNLKSRYYSKGITSVEEMNKTYASSTSWASKVNNYVNIIKNA